MADNARETIARALARVDFPKHLLPTAMRQGYETRADAILAALAAAGQTYEDGVRAGMEKAAMIASKFTKYPECDNAQYDRETGAWECCRYPRDCLCVEQVETAEKITAAIRAAAPTTGGDK